MYGPGASLSRRNTDEDLPRELGSVSKPLRRSDRARSDNVKAPPSFRGERPSSDQVERRRIKTRCAREPPWSVRTCPRGRIRFWRCLDSVRIFGSPPALLASADATPTRTGTFEDVQGPASGRFGVAVHTPPAPANMEEEPTFPCPARTGVLRESFLPLAEMTNGGTSRRESFASSGPPCSPLAKKHDARRTRRPNAPRREWPTPPPPCPRHRLSP